MPAWFVLAAVVIYIGCLFAIASWGDREGQAPNPVFADRWIYSFSLAVYCTSWTFFGAVGTAAGSGWEYLAIYLGPLLVITLFHPVFRRMVETGKRQHTTSIADFISTRYGKSQAVAALVTFIAAFGAIPYIALQLKSVATSFTALTGPLPAGTAPAPSHETVLLTALALGFFAILFGTRHADVTRHNRGMILAIAFESAVKLAALSAVGLLALLLLTDRAAEVPAAMQPFALGDFDDRFWTLTLLSMGAILCLPRQFHVAVVECQDRAGLGTARWAFSGYLVLTSLVVIPITLVGLSELGPAGGYPDLFVLSLPQAQGLDWLALLAFIGGFSAATGMVIVATVALSTMITNDLVAPVLMGRQLGVWEEGPDLAHRLRAVRRAVIIALLVLSYLFQRSAESGEALADFGILSFAAAVQFAPALIGGLYWRGGRKLGVIWGLSAGFALWLITLLMPAYMGIPGAGPLSAFLPGIALDPLTQGVILSLGINILIYIAASRFSRASVGEQVQAAEFVGDWARPAGPSRTAMSPQILTRDLRLLLERCLGADASREAFAAFRTVSGQSYPDSDPADEALLQFTEQQLARVIGTPSARILLAGVLNRKGLPVEDLVTLIDETSQTIQFSRDLLQTTLETIPQGVSVVDEKLQLVAWNSAYARMFSYPAALLRVGSPIADLIRFNAARGECGPGRIEDHVTRRVAHLRRGQPYRSERERPDGRVLLIEGVPMAGGGYVATFTDMTQQKKTEAALVQSERSIRFYTDAMPALIAYVDRERRLRFANRAYLDRYGATRDIIGTKIETYLGAEDLVLRDAFVEAALTGRRVSFDNAWVGPDGARTHMQVTYTPQLGDDGRVAGFFALYQDITARREAEIALQATNESLEQRVAERTEELSLTADALAEATRSKTRFLAAASHDLLQPLNAARLFASALQEDLRRSDPPAAELVTNIDTAIGSADRLLRALLDISKLDAGGLTPNLTRFEITGLLNELEMEFAPLAAANGLRFRVLPSALSVQSDRGLLHSVMQNLVSNAVRYTEKGGVLLGCRKRGASLSIEVWDTGPGIPEDKHADIFKEFHRLPNAKRSSDGGMGLGLAITERITTLLDHPLALRSRPGRGSVFAVRVPLAPAAGHRKNAPAAALRLSPFSDLRVLCLDDERPSLEGLAALLSRWGAKVTLASNLAEAREAEAAPPPDLVLLDYHFDPEFTGPQVFEILKTRWPAVPPAILITADRSPEVEMLAEDLGFGLLQKPIEAASLRALMSGMLRRAAE